MRRSTFLTGFAAAALVLLGSPASRAENIDPGATGDQYAWGENVGWLNAEPLGNGGPGVDVQDFKLTGWMWGENIGWISLSCENTASCASESYGVTNDGFGTLRGFAWGENTGWIQFEPEGAPRIDPATGEFSGYAWGENLGWVRFASTGPFPFRVKTDWCQAVAAPPGSGFTLTAAKGAGTVTLSWTALAAAAWYDAVRGDLAILRGSKGAFDDATLDCIGDKVLATSVVFSGDPAPGSGFWFLVRGSNCKGHGTYDTGQPSQFGSRDAEIAASGHDCQ